MKRSSAWPPFRLLKMKVSMSLRPHLVDLAVMGAASANADEAIEILEGRDDIRVIFTDIHMPGSMDGLKLARAVRDRWPPIKIIVTSGREYPKMSDIPEGGRFFPKPYSPTQVQTALREWA